MKIKYSTAFFFALSAVGCVFNACADDLAIPLGKVISSAEYFDGKNISVCGWFRVGMETCVISSSKGAPEFMEAWVIPSSEICLPENALNNPIESWSIVSGIFRAKGGFGIFGSYSNAIEAANINIIKYDCSIQKKNYRVR